jgi:hypothetical protein
MTLPSLAYAAIPYQVLGTSAGATALIGEWTFLGHGAIWFLHLCNRRKQFSFPVRLGRLRLELPGALPGALPHRCLDQHRGLLQWEFQCGLAFDNWVAGLSLSGAGGEARTRDIQLGRLVGAEKTATQGVSHVGVRKAPKFPGAAGRLRLIARRPEKPADVDRRAQSVYSSRRRTQDWPWPSSSRPFGTRSM